MNSLEYSINLRERCGFYSRSEAETARFCFVEASRETIEVVNDAMNLSDEEGANEKIKIVPGTVRKKAGKPDNVSLEENTRFWGGAAGECPPLMLYSTNPSLIA